MSTHVEEDALNFICIGNPNKGTDGLSIGPDSRGISLLHLTSLAVFSLFLLVILYIHTSVYIQVVPATKPFSLFFVLSLSFSLPTGHLSNRPFPFLLSPQLSSHVLLLRTFRSRYTHLVYLSYRGCRATKTQRISNANVKHRVRIPKRIGSYTSLPSFFRVT